MIDETVLTLDKLKAAMALARVPSGGLAPINMKIIVSDYALKVTEERNFPASRYRSKRIRKKLLKRFGGEFKLCPCIWKTPAGIIVHPALYNDLMERLNDARATSTVACRERGHASERR